MNEEIISQLTELRNYYHAEKDPFRALAYAKAATAIKNIPAPITSIDQLTGIKGIGPKITQKIDQLFNEGKIQKLASIQAKQDPKRTKTIADFLTIYGIGPICAAKLYDIANIQTLKQLARASILDSTLLTAAQKIGLRYREALIKRIHRPFINTFQFTVTYCLNETFGETFRLQTAGSFRRGKPTSGDIDIMIESVEFGLREAVGVLISYGLVTDVLALDSKKFMGVAHCAGGDPFRLDIFMVDGENWWAALVTHTGPKDLNTMMRTKAASMDMKLSDQGLFKGTRKIKIASEKDLFKKLHMDYIIPTKR